MEINIRKFGIMYLIISIVTIVMLIAFFNGEVIIAMTLSMLMGVLSLITMVMILKTPIQKD